MSWSDVLGACIGVLAVALTAWAARRRGLVEGEYKGLATAREPLEKSYAVEDELQKKLKDTEQGLAVVGEAWNRALEERDRMRVTADVERARRRKAEDELLGESRDYAAKLAEFQRRLALYELQVSEVKQSQEAADAATMILSGQFTAEALELINHVEDAVLARKRGFTHARRAKRLMDLCADARKRWSKP